MPSLGRLAVSSMGVANEVRQLADRSVAQTLAFAVERFVDFHHRLLHPLVSFLRAAHEQQIFAFGDAGVPVVSVQSDAENARHFLVALGPCLHDGSMEEGTN